MKRLGEGRIDILIGTHRLLSSDVQFKDLGLLIIDEEQRFGVTHKETLKKMRTEVDVLTLTATPIPRTLYMALSGVRDISTINTPPEERLPIVTHVGPYSPRAGAPGDPARDGARRAGLLRPQPRADDRRHAQPPAAAWCPKRALTIAHGQMAENELSAAHGAVHRRRGGCAAVHLDHRIGAGYPQRQHADRRPRRHLRAGAALPAARAGRARGAARLRLFLPPQPHQPPTPEGRQRLETIAENTQLGAGFSIAMRDLEIRGTGDILGTRQHGHIAAVGFHLYTGLLAEAVRRMRRRARSAGRRPAADPALNLQPATANVELPLPVGIPADYVPDKTVRLGLVPAHGRHAPRWPSWMP